MNLTGLLFVLAFSAGCLLAFTRHPIWGLVAYLGAFYFSPSDRWWGTGFLGDIRWLLIAAVVTALAIPVNKKSMRAPVLPFFRHKITVGLCLFIAYLLIQSVWAMDQTSHWLLIEIYLKLLIAVYLIYRCVDSEENLNIFLWAHVIGCAYLGWLVFSYHGGDRFEDFGSPGINEANAGALQVVSGVIVAATLFLNGNFRQRATLFPLIPVLLNALVATVSRSGFLAIVVAGLAFNVATPPKLRKRVFVLSILAAVLLLLLTNPIYWSRMDTIKYRGEDVTGVDTGGGRPAVVRAQWQMFKDHPMGVGHMGTTALSPYYIEEQLWVQGGKASHNTFMSAIVDHGIPGALFYIGMLLWIFRSIRTLWRTYRTDTSLTQRCVPMLMAFFAAMTVGDMFVQYPRFETRWWFIAVTMVMLNFAAGRTGPSEGIPRETKVIPQPWKRVA